MTKTRKRRTPKPDLVHGYTGLLEQHYRMQATMETMEGSMDILWGQMTPEQRAECDIFACRLIRKRDAARRLKGRA